MGWAEDGLARRRKKGYCHKLKILIQRPTIFSFGSYKSLFDARAAGSPRKKSMLLLLLLLPPSLSSLVVVVLLEPLLLLVNGDEWRMAVQL